MRRSLIVLALILVSCQLASAIPTISVLSQEYTAQAATLFPGGPPGPNVTNTAPVGPVTAISEYPPNNQFPGSGSASAQANGLITTYGGFLQTSGGHSVNGGVVGFASGTATVDFFVTESLVFHMRSQGALSDTAFWTISLTNLTDNVPVVIRGSTSSGFHQYFDSPLLEIDKQYRLRANVAMSGCCINGGGARVDVNVPEPVSLLLLAIGMLLFVTSDRMKAVMGSSPRRTQLKRSLLTLVLLLVSCQLALAIPTLNILSQEYTATAFASGAPWGPSGPHVTNTASIGPVTAISAIPPSPPPEEFPPPFPLPSGFAQASANGAIEPYGGFMVASAGAVGSNGFFGFGEATATIDFTVTEALVLSMHSRGFFTFGGGWILLTNVTDNASVVSRGFSHDLKDHFDSALLETNKQYRLEAYGFIHSCCTDVGFARVDVNVPEASALLLLGLGLAGLARLRNSAGATP